MVADMFLAETEVWSFISTWSIIREARVYTYSRGKGFKKKETNSALFALPPLLCNLRFNFILLLDSLGN